jgi:Nif-specific regulatory protein
MISICCWTSGDGAEALTKSHGNISATAESLGLTRRTLSLKMQKFGMNYKHYR